MKQGDEAWLEFLGAAMIADIYVNGEKKFHHEGGYSAFRVPITDCLKEQNTIVAVLNNEENQICYPQKADFTFYGGLYCMVNLIIVPSVHFALDYWGASGLNVTPAVDLETGRADITLEAWTNTETEVTFTAAGQTVTASTEQKHAKAVLTISEVHLWDGINDPYLYLAKASLPGGDEVSTRFGCRQFACDPQKGFILNGRPYALRGVSCHQDLKGIGNALTLEHHQQDMEIIREIGATTLRLAHYQHGQEFFDLCDENGLIVWAEIPYITMHMPKGRNNTLSQMKELIVQNYNHPSIAVWVFPMKSPQPVQ